MSVMIFSGKNRDYALMLFTAVILLLCGLARGAPTNENDLIVEGAIPESSVLPEDTVFYELHVSPDGAYAVDSAGKEWEFDFETDEFIGEETRRSGTKTVFGKRRPEPAPTVPELPDIEEITKNIEKSKKMKGLKLGAVTIDTDEKVRGPIVAMGPVIVRGKVIGDVFSYQNITVTSTGIITGDARAPKIEKLPGGLIMGDRIEGDLPQLPDVNVFAENSHVALIVSIIILIALLIFGLLTIALFSRPVERVKVCLQKSFIKSFFIGLLTWVIYTPVMGLLTLTIIGIPVALIALPILLVLALILGIVAFSQLTGEKLSGYISGGSKSRLSQFVTGILFLMIFWIIMSLFMAGSGGVREGFGILFLVLSIIIWSIGLTAGLGAVILTRFGRQECKATLDITIKADGAKPPPPTPPPLSSEN